MTDLPSAPYLDSATVADSARRVLGAMVQRAPDALADSSRLFVDLGMKSSNVLHLLLMLERELDVRFDVESLEPGHLETVGSLIAFVTRVAAR